MSSKVLSARYRSAAEIRASGALGNLGQGVEITAHGLSHRLIARVGAGCQTGAVHVVTVNPGEESDRYRYDFAEEAVPIRLCRYLASRRADHPGAWRHRLNPGGCRAGYPCDTGRIDASGAGDAGHPAAYRPL